MKPTEPTGIILNDEHTLILCTEYLSTGRLSGAACLPGHAGESDWRATEGAAADVRVISLAVGEYVDRLEAGGMDVDAFLDRIEGLSKDLH